MGDSKYQIIKEEQLTLKDQALHWEKGTLLLPQISRIWAGRSPKELSFALLLTMLLIVTATGVILPDTVAAAVVSLAAIVGAIWPLLAKRKNAVNIELTSGVTCSFLAEREELAVQACRLIVEYAAGKENTETSVIQLYGEVEIPAAEAESKEEPSAKVKELKLESNMTNLTSMDLKKLYEHEQEKEAPDQTLLSLIEETIPLVEAGNRQESKIKFTKFIEAGLIQECNELGLNSLIKDIKSSIY